MFLTCKNSSLWIGKYNIMIHRGWDGWMASPTQWTWFWVNSGNWWWTGRPGVMQSMGPQRVGHDWATELNWWLTGKYHSPIRYILWYPLYRWEHRGTERLSNQLGEEKTHRYLQWDGGLSWKKTKENPWKRLTESSTGSESQPGVWEPPTAAVYQELRWPEGPHL